MVTGTAHTAAASPRRPLNRSFEALCVRAGVRRVRFHDLRHTCASLLHEQGADARLITEQSDRLAKAVAVKHCGRDKSQRPCGSLHRASGLLCTRQDSNLQPSDP
ncbi:tyrosine-type recombinase/integrase [Streptomyces iakyrus]|uniref:tyrosine-type recombinase/integrase n=1 Tax=Streptomyces iakyrus TaxID=68219 RepID=UPI003839D081